MRTVLIFLLLSAAMSAQASELLYIVNQNDNSVKLYDGTSGTFYGNIVPANSSDLNGANGIAIGGDGSLYVSGQYSNNIGRFSSSGAFLGDFVAPGSGGLSSPQTIHFGPDGNLYATSSMNDKILKYSGTTGAFLGVFANLGQPVHDGPIDFVFGPDGKMYVTTFDSGRILRLDATTGAFIDTLPGVADPNTAFIGATFGPDGNFYVAGLDKNTFEGSVYQYSTSGALLGTFVANGSGGLATPSDLLFDETGALDVLDVGNPSVLRYDSSGAFLNTLVAPGSGGLDSGFFFAAVTTPEPGTWGITLTGLMVGCVAILRRRLRN